MFYLISLSYLCLLLGGYPRDASYGGKVELASRGLERNYALFMETCHSH